METGQPRDGERVLPDQPEQLAKAAVEMAVWAPSVHNTQPWWFGRHGARISLHADVDRRLDVADPGGREMVISCGAALFTLQIAVRQLGYEPHVRLLPDPDRPNLLADISIDEAAQPSEDVTRLHAQIQRRRTHRGAFRPSQVPVALLSRLRDEARREGATFHVAVDGRTRGVLAALTAAGEHFQHLNPDYVSELARWAPTPGSRRQDGVHEEAYPREPERTEPYFPGRDFARGHGWGAEPTGAGVREHGVTGIVAILTTADDTRKDWLHAGQALQRILLRAAAEEDLSAAFHTQALEVPELRAFIRTRLCAGDHPQMLLRLGAADVGRQAVRRRTDDVLAREPS
ncbi:MAG: Acg family FMN-binding oxidoreductase [Actinomadura sp.]